VGRWEILSEEIEEMRDGMTSTLCGRKEGLNGIELDTRLPCDKNKL